MTGAVSRFVPSRKAYVIGALVVLSLILVWPLRVKSEPVEAVTEQSIKAAYLYKFAAYVEWPEYVFTAESAPVTIGVLGSDALAKELQKITAERTVNGRQIAVRLVAEPEELAGVQILFVAGSGTTELISLAEVARTNSVLVVTEAADALEQGSVINFRPIDKRIRFDVSLDSADRNRLKLSARLLAVANYVQPRRR
jgi:hypothetical protein